MRYLETRTTFFQGGLAGMKTSHSDSNASQLEHVVSVVSSALRKHVHQMIVNAHAIGHVMEDRPTSEDGGAEQDPLVFYAPVAGSDEDGGKRSTGFVPLKETKVATGIFPCAGMMNHSCEPNIATRLVSFPFSNEHHYCRNFVVSILFL